MVAVRNITAATAPNIKIARAAGHPVAQVQLICTAPRFPVTASSCRQLSAYWVPRNLTRYVAADGEGEAVSSMTCSLWSPRSLGSGPIDFA